jgi:bla regulator protein BlaR1
MSIDSHVLESLGWALIHSTWQAAGVFIIYAAASAIFGKDSNRRYVLALFALIAIPTAFVITLLLLVERPAETVFAVSSYVSITSRDVLSTTVVGLMDAIKPLASWIDLQLTWVIRIWFAGSLIGMLRVLSGMMYLRSLRLNALPVAREWEEKVNSLAMGLFIKRKVSVAEARVSTPMVIGYIKPIVLFPIGLLSGLTEQQVEAILLHELAHIRRHDFVINVFQCMMESIFFFNPVVWILSSRIRTLREHCCDDIVISRGVNPLTYVKTLAFVEEMSSAGTLALALTGERNQMLNRMKRIMEKSVVKKEWGSMRLLPLGLIVLGLICASWLSIETEPPMASKSILGVVGDSTIEEATRNEMQSSIYFQRKRTDEVLQQNASNEAFDSNVWPHPGPSPVIFEFDSIPSFYHAPGEWEKFEKEFTQKFSKEFGEFFNKNHEQFEKIMAELREQHELPDLLALERMNAMSADQMKVLEEELRHMDPQIAGFENFPLLPLDFPTPDQEMVETAKLMAEEQRALSEQFREDAELQRAQLELMRIDELMLRENEQALHKYENAVIEQLIQDGYLKKGEKLNDLQIHDDEITVNGKKVKEKDVKKYKDISDKYEPRWSPPHRPE